MTELGHLVDAMWQALEHAAEIPSVHSSGDLGVIGIALIAMYLAARAVLEAYDLAKRLVEWEDGQ